MGPAMERVIAQERVPGLKRSNPACLELSQQITNDVWTRVAEEGVLSEEIGVWIADFQGIVPTS